MQRMKPDPMNASQRMQVAREQALSEALKRKQEYLGARVPRELKERVLKKAEKMGIPVSILIRNVLEEAFSVDVSGESQPNKVSLAAELERRAQKPQILGWKTIELNGDHACDNCEVVMSGGSTAVMAITPNEDDAVIVCPDCKVLLQSK